MNARSDDDWDRLRERILGLGERSIHKSHYPELQRRLSELEASEERYRSLVNNLSAGIVRASTEPGGPILEANPAAAVILGYESVEALIGAPAPQLLWDPDEAAALVEELRQGIPIRNRELRFRHASGRPVHVLWSGTPHFDAGGRLAWVDAAFEDLTERKRLEDQLLQARKMEAIGRLAGGVAHDFNNLLTAILGYDELLVEGLEPGSALHDCAAEIGKACRQAARLTGDLLAFARRQAQQLQLVDLNRVIAGMSHMLGRLCGERIELLLDLEPSLAVIRADAGQLEQMLLNLVVNARDAIPGRGRITVATRRGGSEGAEEVVLSVADTGSGIAPELQDHLFEPFFTTKERGKGTGLGLSLVYGVVQQSGGQIDVESEPGAGTTFRVTFPGIAGAAETRTAGVVGERPAGGTERILVVEDETPVRRLLVHVLGQAGYHITEASSAEDALAVAGRGNTERPDLLLTDVIMPGASGPQLAAAMEARWPGLRVLFISGYSESGRDIPDGLLEQSEMLRKPFTPLELLARVRAVLDGPSPEAEMTSPAPGAITIYHNPRCSKSRGALALLEERGLAPRVIEYLHDAPTARDVLDLARRAGVSVRELVREDEDEYAAAGLGPSSSDEDLARAVERFPVLLQRPIVVRGDRAVVARPSEKVLELLRD